jgi:hypothetical protein
MLSILNQRVVVGVGWRGNGLDLHRDVWQHCYQTPACVLGNHPNSHRSRHDGFDIVLMGGKRGCNRNYVHHGWWQALESIGVGCYVRRLSCQIAVSEGRATEGFEGVANDELHLETLLRAIAG